MLVLCAAIFLDALDVSMMGVALPSIQADLGLSTSSLQWLVSGYVVGFGGFLLLGGRAADLLGRRKVFLIALAVFLVTSAIGGIANTDSLLIVSRFLKGVAAAFTAPAGLSIITTSFAEGPVRNRALAIYTATGGAGFSLGLVIGGVLTEISWRLVFFVPVVIAAAALAGGLRLIPADVRAAVGRRNLDFPGAASITAALLLLVFTVVEAPEQGWSSARTLLSLIGVAALMAAFVAIEQRSKSPLVRLGILRSGPLVRANLAAMTFSAAWLSTQFIATLYMQDLRGWSALETGVAFLPTGLVGLLVASRVAPLIQRFGLPQVIAFGFALSVLAYALFLRIDVDSNYWTVLFPTFALVGIGFGFAYGPLNIAATNDISADEQGLASGMVQTSFQFGGALVLAIVTAVNSAAVGGNRAPGAVLNGYQTALIVPVIVAALGLAITLVSARATRPVPTLATASRS
jgi:EmrB/QacA subfamily drug resistance transporter